MNEQRIIQTDTGATDGQTKCPKCGATDISLNTNTGMLRCNFCRHEFEPEKVVGLDGDIHNLQGDVIASGASDIIAETTAVVTFKCSSCGAEVVIDTNEATQARCHWCRNTLSVNQQIPNGVIPDVVLPFALTKQQAQEKIKAFVKKRRFFAHPRFRAQFNANNIIGVYLPYMIVDANAHSVLHGQAEKQTRKYTRGTGDDKITFYDADLYNVGRDFDILIDDLPIEASADKLNQDTAHNTNNIINSILPFDTENCVKWDANYLKGFNSEKRDINIDQLRGVVQAQIRDIARIQMSKSMDFYDRGIKWTSEDLNIKGQQWKTAYLPVWLYSYQERKRNGTSFLHYVAVNARTGETMGSIPINKSKLVLASAGVEIIGIILGTLILLIS